MIQKFTISRDDAIYHAWPDVALTPAGRLVCVFSECTHHGDRSYTRVMCCHSEDRGRTWSPKRPVSEPLYKKEICLPHWNCPRITALADGRLVIVVDQILGSEHGKGPDGSQTNWLFLSDDDGERWQGPIATPVNGIVPDQVTVLKHGPNAGRWLLAAHRTMPDGNWMQRLWFSDNEGKAWQGPVTIAQSHRLKLCEGSVLELPSGALVCFMRENSFQGLDAFKAISEDGGQTWHGPYAMPMPGCHRPVAGLLGDGAVLITHRYLPGGKRGWGSFTQNTFATLTDVSGALTPERDEVATRVLPLDFDRSCHADTGYTGWVQFEDGEVYIVNYILDDAPKAQIRGYALRKEDFILPEPS